jgi:ubiquinone biosynthesis protein
MARTRQRKIRRLSEIAQVAVRHGFGYFFESHRLRDVLPWHHRLTAAEGPPISARGQHLRELLDELGPTFVKFGQLLSTRPDVVPPDIVAELRKLQDAVTPVPFSEIERVVEEDLHLAIGKLFLEFEERPIAAASIGQVHRAILPDGTRVAVKIQRPDAPRQIASDLALLNQAAKLARERIRALDFIDVRGLVDEFGRGLRQELDYRTEARNAQAFHRNFADDPNVVVPRVFASHTSERVLTLELIDGVQLRDLDLDTYTVEERKQLAYLITEAWLTMIFRHGFFHADPHPANILVIDRTRIGLVDFGLAGRLSGDDMAKLTRLFIDAASENVDQLPKRLADLGVRYPKEGEERFAADLRELYYRYYGAKLTDIDPLQVIRESFQLIYANNVRLPTRFVLLDKAIATVGSVGVELYEDFNVFEVARPYARGLLAGRFAPGMMAATAQKEVLGLARILRDAPYQLHGFLEQAREGKIEVGFVHKGLDEFMHRIDIVFNRLVVALVVAGGLVGSSMIGVFAKNGPQIAGINAISFFGFVLSAVLGVWLLLGVIRSGRL